MPPLVGMTIGGVMPGIVTIVHRSYFCLSFRRSLPAGRQGGIYEILPDAFIIMKHKRDACACLGLVGDI